MSDGDAPGAAVDIGSNSVRLLVVDAAGQRLTRRMTITRLGAGIDASGGFDEAALERTLATLRDYRRCWNELGVHERVRVVATSAVRDAHDRERFLQAARSAVGVDVEVLTGEQEAELAFLGAARAVDVASPTLVVDIGGGSTELILGEREGGVSASVSLQLGCVRITERHLHGDPPSAAAVTAARAHVGEQLSLADGALSAAGARATSAASLVGVAGTVTTVGALSLGLDAYREELIHGTRVSADVVRTLARRLLGMSSSRRARLGGVQSGREDVIHGGVLVLSEVIDRYGFAGVTVSEADNLDALAASLDRVDD